MAKSAKIARIEALEKDLEVALSAAQTKRIEPRGGDPLSF